jgi:hypothetical protein
VIEIALHCRGRLMIRPIGVAGIVASRLPASDWVVEPRCDGAPRGAHVSIAARRSGLRLSATASIRAATSHGLPIELDAAGWRQGVDLATPATLQIGDTRIDVIDTASMNRFRPATIDTSPSVAGGPVSNTTTAAHNAVAALLAGATEESELFASAAGMLVDPGGLVAGFVLRRRTGAPAGWDIVGSAIPHPEHGVWFDLSLADRLLEHPVAWYEPWVRGPIEGSIPPRSPRPRYAAAPILDPTGRVVGAVIGLLQDRGERQAEWVSLVAATLARVAQGLEQRAETARRRTRLERWLSPGATRRVAGAARLEARRTRCVSVLAAELWPTECGDRDRDRMAAPAELSAEVHRLREELIATLVRCVAEQSGTVVQHEGDDLVAAWNAPFDQADHAERACQAAHAMEAAAAPFLARIAGASGVRWAIAVGVHRGDAIVGAVRGRWPVAYAVRGDAADAAAQLRRLARRNGGGVLLSGAIGGVDSANIAASRRTRAA